MKLVRKVLINPKNSHHKENIFLFFLLNYVRRLMFTKLMAGMVAACKLELVKKEMARMNISILGVSKLKWTGMGEFNSDDHYIYYCGQESLRRNGVAIIVNKRV